MRAKEQGQESTQAPKMNTLERIIDAARAEFLKKGYKSASLRNIVKTAGVTTGAFYGYYASKEALFDALVGEQYETLLSRYRETQETFSSLPPEEQPENMGSVSGDCMQWMVDYIYQHFDVFKLLLCCAEGTRYENMVHEMVQIEVDATHRFIGVLETLGRTPPPLDPQLEHMLISGMFAAFFEMVIHEMPKENANLYLHELRAFYMAGWKELIGF